MIQQISNHMHAEMHRCPWPLPDAVVSGRVVHVVKRLAQFDQTVNEALDDLQVRIGLPRSVNN